MDTVTRAVRDMFKDKADFLPSPEIIIDEVGKFYGIDPDAIRGQGRTKDTALARQIAMYQIRRMTNLSLKEIGKEFDNRDHTTVMHSIDRIEKLTKQSPRWPRSSRTSTPTSTPGMNNRCPHFHGFLWECGQPCVDKQAAALPVWKAAGRLHIPCGRAKPCRPAHSGLFPQKIPYGLLLRSDPLLSREIAILRTEVTLP